jgi:tetratricopeptide (TPR) repeat protein
MGWRRFLGAMARAYKWFWARDWRGVVSSLHIPFVARLLMLKVLLIGRRGVVLCGVLSVLAASGSRVDAQGPTAPVGAFKGEPFSSSVEEMRAASAAVPVDGDFETQVLLEEGLYRIADDGTLLYRHRLIFRVDGKDAVEGWSEASMTWDPWYEKPAQIHARVLQADGRFLELDQKTITDAPVKGEDSETYSSEHERRAPLPGVSVGSIVEEVEEVEEKTPYFAAGGIYRFRFKRGEPIAMERMIVDLPSALPFKELRHHLEGVTVVSGDGSGGRRHVVYEKAGIGAAYNSDIDLSTNDPATPTMEFATGESWKSVASAYAALADPQTVVEDAKAILPADLPAGRAERIEAIVARLHAEVRYTGVEFGAAKLTPQRPAEVIKRHYGDCKDKATLLVAMLRAAGIPADLALLDTGPGEDVEDSMAGMNEFDHAIVYVPAAGSDPAVWIDATAQYYAPGSLPFDDEGRKALIIAPQTSGLTLTPAPKPEDSVLLETRVFTLAEHGPAHVVESSHTKGIVDANYRSLYGAADTTKVHQDLENYAHNAYLAKDLIKVSHGPADDLSKPFDLTLEIGKAKRGTTALNEALVVLYPSMVTSALPRWFGTTPPVIGPDTSATDKANLLRAQASRMPSYSFRPYLDERRVRILIPDGYALRSVPPDKTTKLGMATLVEEYDASEKGVITADLKFDTGPGTLTAEQAVAMRDAVVELEKREYVGVYFDQVGAKALADGHIRAALDADRGLIAAHPTEALPHVQLARALLEAGIGSQAHVEARKATELDKTSAVAFSTLGWTLEHDSLGVRFGKGYDLAGAVAAYKQSIVLDPDDDEARFDLGILYEFNARGERYAEDAQVAEAVATYKEMIARTKDSNPGAAAQYRDNMLYALLFEHKFAELDGELAKLPMNNSHASLGIVSATAQKGAAAGIAQADRGNIEAGDRNKNLLAAGRLLAQLRMYPEASAVLQAGIGGAGDNAPTTARQIELYKNLKPASLAPLPVSDPARPVQAMVFDELAGTITAKTITESLSHHAFSSEASLQMEVQKDLAGAGALSVAAEKNGMSLVVLLDLVAGNMTFTSSGDDVSGYTVLGKSPGSEDSHYFVVREDGAYRLVAESGDDIKMVGNEVIWALGHHQEKMAKALLDWKRDLVHKGGGDDPFAGYLLPRFWTVGSSKPGADSPEAMRLAGISMLAGSMDAKPYVAEIVAAQEKATGSEQEDLDLLLAEAAIGAEEPELGLRAVKRLLDEEPDSEVALGWAGQAYALEGHPEAWEALLAPRIEKRPKDRELLDQQVRAYEMANDFAAARKTQQEVLDSGKAESGDYNNFAWMGLFDNHLGEAELKAAQQSNMLSKNGSFADLHTTACVYAAEGKTTEARQVLTEAMQAGNIPEPNSAVWYALGIIYEDYGALDAALDAYEKVQAHEYDDHTYVDPASTYVLAQVRVKALKK